MNRIRVALALLLAAAGLAGAIALASPALAHHSTAAEIRNSSNSILPIWVDDYCVSRTFSSSKGLIYPGDTTFAYDRGFQVTIGYEYDAFYGPNYGTQWANNKVSDGRPVCIGNAKWLVVVREYHN